MIKISEAIDIDAPADEVWSHVSDFASYPKWNPYLLAFTTSGTTGTPITLTLTQANWKRPHTVHPTLDVLDERSREVRWRRKVLVPGVFDTEHFVRVEARGEGRCKLIQQEKVSGIVSRLIPSSGKRATGLALRAMNRALKLRVEQASEQ